MQSVEFFSITFFSMRNQQFFYRKTQNTVSEFIQGHSTTVSTTPAELPAAAGTVRYTKFNNPAGARILNLVLPYTMCNEVPD